MLYKNPFGCFGEEPTAGRSEGEQGGCLRGYCRDECGLGQALGSVTFRIYFGKGADRTAW